MTWGLKFMDFQAPVLFSSTFKALNLGEKNSSTFKGAWGPQTLLYFHIYSLTVKIFQYELRLTLFVNEV